MYIFSPLYFLLKLCNSDKNFKINYSINFHLLSPWLLLNCQPNLPNNLPLRLTKKLILIKKSNKIQNVELC